MKKLIIILILIPLFGKAKNLDTIYVRYLQQQSQDWLWLIGRYQDRNDSVAIKAFRKIRVAVQANVPALYTTNVTFDSIPGKVVVEMYRMVKTAPAGEIALRYAAITAAIAAKTVLSSWLVNIDNMGAAEFLRYRNIGKNQVLDQ